MKRGSAWLFPLLLLCATVDGRSQTTASRECSAGSPGVQHLAKIENTRDSSYHCLGVSIDGSANIVAIRFEKHPFAGTSGSGQVPLPVEVHEFAAAEIGAGRGVVIDGRPGHDAVLLRGPIIGGAAVARLVISYLYNGFVGEFRECSVELVRDEASRWRLVDARHNLVSHIVVRTWALPLVGTVGIETLQGACT